VAEEAPSEEPAEPTEAPQPTPEESAVASDQPLGDTGADSAETEQDEDSGSTPLSQQNAVDKAESYLQYSAFSRTGLIEQLEFEGFSPEDATLAVDSLDVDYGEQAKKKAEDYIDYSAFSRSGLIEQLEFEDFSPEDSAAAVDSLSIDYNEQAAKKAQEYLDSSSFSRSGLIDQLVFEGFTQEQATYGAGQTGL